MSRDLSDAYIKQLLVAVGWDREDIILPEAVKLKRLLMVVRQYGVTR